MAGVYRSANATAPAHSATAVTPSDATVLPITRALYVGGAGNLAVTMGEDGNNVTFVGVLAGMVYPLQVSKVLATNTTATNIVALY